MLIVKKKQFAKITWSLKVKRFKCPQRNKKDHLNMYNTSRGENKKRTNE